MRLRLLVITSLILSILYGCTNSPIQNEASELAKRNVYMGLEQKARKVAEDFLTSEGVRLSNGDWAGSAVITDLYPVYMDGVDDICYFECKVTRGGEDAGCIRVNVNETDLKVPCYMAEGLTQTEEFAKELEVSPKRLKVYMNGFFESLAELDGFVAIERGFDGTGHYKKGGQINTSMVAKKRNQFADRVIEAGGVNPRHTKKKLEWYYHSDSLIADSLEKAGVDISLSKTAAAKYSWHYDELNGTFASGWHLPHWEQAHDMNGYATGCSPMAITLMYSYWKQFRGKSRLFNGVSDLNPISYQNNSYDWRVATVGFQIRNDCTCVYNSDYSVGCSIEAIENDAELYGDRCFYDCVLDMDRYTETRQLLGTGDFQKCVWSYEHIVAERPVFVALETHAVAVEGAKYCTKYDGWRTLWDWWDYEAWYLANYGYGNLRQWICAEANYGSRASETRNDGNCFMWVN